MCVCECGGYVMRVCVCVCVSACVGEKGVGVECVCERESVYM